MEKKLYQGIYAALITPYTKTGEVNYNQLQKLVNHLLEQGIAGFYVGGSTAEAFLLTEEERKGILEAVVEANEEKGTVFSHVGAISTDMAIRLAEHAEETGVDAVSAVAPFYYNFTEKEIINYYCDIMRSTDLPMIVYNIPSFSGFTLTESVLNELKKKGNVAGVKFTSPDFLLLQQIRANNPELSVFNGFDQMLSAGLIMGATGAIGSTYNCLAPIACRIYDSFQNGETDQVEYAQNLLNRVLMVMRKYGVFSSIKTLLEFEGIECNGCRKPFSQMTEDGRIELKKVYEDVMGCTARWKK
ncbi:MAG: N-acetylneuraminate lyase [Lachnospiraceae bacterium]|nr:N-acetylneuraminate lyase [Lachnospiraceae bacterium]